MIGILKGTAVGSDVVMTDGGVGYEVRTLADLVDGAPTTLYTHAVYREDSATLYAFEDADSRDTFRELLRANGVGPAMAMNMLAKHGVGGIKRIFRDKDENALKDLTTVEGIGPKSAQKLLLSVNLNTDGAEESPRSITMRQAEAALVGLGFREPEVREALEGIKDSGDVGAVVREALAILRPGEKASA